MFDPWSVLTEKQATVARAFVAERERERKHLVIYLSGAHAYGFPSPDSDLDLKCVHIAPTTQLVGLEMPSDPLDRIDIVDGVELDYGSNELAPVLRGVIKGNGNFIERILGTLALGGDAPLLAEARAVVKPLLSRRVAKHYGGFATSQLRAFDEIYLLTGGGPGTATEVVSYTIFRRFFTEGQTGYGSAMSVVVLFAIAFVFIAARGLTERRRASA